LNTKKTRHEAGFFLLLRHAWRDSGASYRDELLQPPNLVVPTGNCTCDHELVSAQSNYTFHYEKMWP
jgi:hypothetical protein